MIDNNPAIKKYIESNSILKIYEKSGICLDVNRRWEEGIDHHPNSLKLMEHLIELDFAYLNDYFCWKMGGDGDNGESLMYLMDIFFELQDSEKNKEEKK